MIRNKDNLLTTAIAAQILGFEASYIRYLIKKGKIKATKMGPNWFMTKNDISKIKRQRFPKEKELSP